MLSPGDPAPYFSAPSSVSPAFHFDTAAGRYIVLCFFASSGTDFATRLLQEVSRQAGRFNVRDLAFFGVSVDPADRDRLQQQSPGVIYFFDDELAVSRKYGVVGDPPDDSPRPAAGAGRRASYRPCTFVLDQALRVLAAVDIGDDPVAHLEGVLRIVEALPDLGSLQAPAPVLTVPYVFEPELCAELVAYYDRHGGRESGFMRDVDGRTVEVSDHSHKRRSDCDVTDPALVRAVQERLVRRVLPAIAQAFQFSATRIERHIVACYDSADGGHFRAHRDNTTLGTAHRRFAVTLNLNAGQFDGGELWFPEFSRRLYKAPTGGAVVFSCSLLHEATPVTRGRRYAFLPFLYDDAAARVREANRRHVSLRAAAPPGVGAAAGG